MARGHTSAEAHSHREAGRAAVRRHHCGRPGALGVSLPSAPPHGGGDVPGRRSVGTMRRNMLSCQILGKPPCCRFGLAVDRRHRRDGHRCSNLRSRQSKSMTHTVPTPKCASWLFRFQGLRDRRSSTLQERHHALILSSPGDWPAPVNDQEHRLFTLVDVLEYRPRTGGSQGHDDYRWDIEGWYGGTTIDSGSKAKDSRTRPSKQITTSTFNCCMGGSSRSITIFRSAPVSKRNRSAGAM